MVCDIDILSPSSQPIARVERTRQQERRQIDNAINVSKESELKLTSQIGDMISVIDMPPPIDESLWWSGKHGFDVGFFPCQCVEAIGDKVPTGFKAMALSTGEGGEVTEERKDRIVSKRKNSTGSSDDGHADSSSPSSSSINSSLHEPSRKPVLRKRGKLISFFRNFILTRPSRGKLKRSGILKERVFGCDLSEHLLNVDQQIPKVLKHCAEFIEAKGVIDGIYRLSGIASNIQRLRLAFDEDRVPDLYGDINVLHDIHSVSSLLKMYFRELPNPICTYNLYDRFVEAAKASDDLRLVLLRNVVQELPSPNYRTLEYLSRHLYRVSLRGSDTGMTAKNVAIVWAPNLLRSKSIELGGVAALQGVGVQAVVTEYLIRHCELIFSDEVTSPSCTLDHGASEKLRSNSLAISAPTSLEDDRNRVLAANMDDNRVAALRCEQKYIEVGGGPTKLPDKYHAILNFPSRKGIGGCSTAHKRSPIAWKAIFTAGKSKKRVDKLAILPELEDLEKSHQSVHDNDLNSALPKSQVIRPSMSAESLVQPLVKRSLWDRISRRQSKEGCEKTRQNNESPTVSMDFDEVRPLKTVEQAVGNIVASKAATESSRCHSRSSSHDSYFDRKLSVQFIADYDEKRRSQSELDLSEIQINFDLEDNEMRIFSDDEAMLSTSAGSDLSRSLLTDRPDCVLKSKTNRRMSFKENFKRFTSPSTSRKVDSSADVNGTGTQKVSIKDKIVRALSPESLRRKPERSSVKSRPTLASPNKKKKLSFSPGSSPTIQSSSVKRSKMEQEKPKRTMNSLGCNQAKDEFDEANHRSSIVLPLSPSITFMDEAPESAKDPNQYTDVSKKTLFIAKSKDNARFTAPSEEGDARNVGHLVVAQVHCDPHATVEESVNATTNTHRAESIPRDGRLGEPKEDEVDGINLSGERKTSSDVQTCGDMFEKESFFVPFNNQRPECHEITDEEGRKSPEQIASQHTSREFAILPVTTTVASTVASDKKFKEINVSVPPPLPAKQVIHLRSYQHRPVSDFMEVHGEKLVFEEKTVNDDHTNFTCNQSDNTESIHSFDPGVNKIDVEVALDSSYQNENPSCSSKSITTACAPIVFADKSERSHVSVQVSNHRHIKIDDSIKYATHFSSNSNNSNVKKTVDNSDDAIDVDVQSESKGDDGDSERENSAEASRHSFQSGVIQDPTFNSKHKLHFDLAPSTLHSSPVPYFRKPDALTTHLTSQAVIETDKISWSGSVSSIKSRFEKQTQLDAGHPSPSARLQVAGTKIPKAESRLHRVDHERWMSKKLSTVSLLAAVEDKQSSLEEEPTQSETSTLQRRNSIHHLPHVDVDDPDRRARIERYKEERRCLLRAEYKVKDYLVHNPEIDVLPQNEKNSFVDNSPKAIQGPPSAPLVVLRKMSLEGKAKSIPRSAAVLSSRMSFPSSVTPYAISSSTGSIEHSMKKKSSSAQMNVDDESGRSARRSQNNAAKASVKETRRKLSAPVTLNSRFRVQQEVGGTTRKTSDVRASSKNLSRKISHLEYSNKIKDMAAFFEQKG